MINKKRFSLGGVQINEPYSASDDILDIRSHVDLVILDIGSDLILSDWSSTLILTISYWTSALILTLPD